MMHTRRMSSVAIALLALSLGMRGQQAGGTGAGEGLQARPEALQREDGVLTLHTGTHLVALDVVVTDKKGHTVPGLTQDGFHIFEDGRPQAVKFFEEHAPVDPALVAKQRAALAALGADVVDMESSAWRDVVRSVPMTTTRSTPPS